MSRSGSGSGNPDGRQGTGENHSSTAAPEELQGGSRLNYQTEWLDLSRGVIEEKQTKQMARALESNKLQNLKTLFLHNNAGDLGMRAMLNAMQEGYLVTVEKLILWNVSSYDQITTAEEGTDTIANAIGRNYMPALHTLDLTSSLPKLIAPRSWSTACQELIRGRLGPGRLLKCKDNCLGCFRMRPTLVYLNCNMCTLNIYSGDDGLKKIVNALSRSRRPLKFLNLRDNFIGDKGAINMAGLLRRGVLPTLEEVDLQNNPVSVVGAREIIQAYLENPLLTASVKLDWPNSVLKERATAFRESNIRLEHRLAELDGVSMEHGQISKSYTWRPEFSLERRSRADPYKFLILCQHSDHTAILLESELESGMQSPAVVDRTPRPATRIRGIEIKRKSFFGRPPRKLVDTEYEEAGEIKGSLSGELANEPTGATSFCCGRCRANEPTSNTQADAASRVTTVDASNVADNDVAGKGVARMYITAHSRGFIEAAISLNATREEETFWDRCKSTVLRDGQDRKKTERQIQSIIIELLMLADRKPRKFQELFGLTRRLLKDGGGKYYPAFVCDTCNDIMENNSQFSPTVVQPTLLEPRRSVISLSQTLSSLDLTANRS